MIVVVRYGGGGGGDRYNNFGDGDRYQRQGSAPPNAGGRWDNLDEDRSFSARRGGGQQDGGDWGNNNRWDNRTDNNAGGKYPQETTKENWTVPLPANQRLEEWVHWTENRGGGSLQGFFYSENRGGGPYRGVLLSESSIEEKREVIFRGRSSVSFEKRGGGSLGDNDVFHVVLWWNVD